MDEPARLARRTSAPDYAANVCAVLQRIRAARNVAECTALLEQAARRLGADAALFTTLMRLGPTAETYRTVLACDARWSTECAARGWCLDDPWVLQALRCGEPVRTAQLPASGQRHSGFAEAAENYGFRSTLIVPAPCPAGDACIGVLVLGSRTPDYFEGEGYAALEVLAWPLAMELQAWWLARVRQELLEQARLTDEDLALLRYEDRGLGSKQIAAELDTLAQTIDCRFQRLSRKLAAPNRRAAVRLAKLHGLI